MSHFALIENGIVVRVNVIEQDVIDSGLFGDPKSWVQTSYNTRGNVHYDPYTGELSADQTKALRGNYAGIGYTYDKENDVFYAPQPYPSWILNKSTWLWEAPVVMPNTIPINLPEHTFSIDWIEDKLIWKYICYPNNLSLPDMIFYWDKDFLEWKIE